MLLQIPLLYMVVVVSIYLSRLYLLLFSYGLCMCATGIVLSTIYANNHLLFLRNVTVLPVLYRARGPY